MKSFFTKLISISISLLLVISTFTACNFKLITINNTSKSDDNIIIPLYPIDCEVTLHTIVQSIYFDNKLHSLPYGIKGKKELSRPKPVVLKWIYNGIDNNVEFTLKISKNKDMSNPIIYSVNENKAEIYNLEIDCTYYWMVCTENYESEICTLYTENSPPRNLYIDGITNVRDIGGWVTQDGVRTNQGLLFRCGRLNSNIDEGNKTLISNNGTKTLLHDLGIKTEIDLRRIENGENGGITSSPLGNKVKYFSCPMISTGGNVIDNKEQIVKVFSLLADRNNYPIILHCTIGTDRTGMISFLLNALLGVPEEELFKDYLFSNYGKIGSGRKIKNVINSAYYQTVINENGNSLKDKTYNFLLNLGVTEEQLNEIITIFTE